MVLKMNAENIANNQMLPDILEVKELAHPQDVNSHIKQGWKLIDTYKATGLHEKQVIKYCIGWPKTAGVLSPQTTQQQIIDRKRFIYSL